MKKFKDITEEMLDLYTRKNSDYGNSFDKSMDEDGLLVLKIRLGDKFSRFQKLLQKNQMVKDESIRDTLIDLANYAVMGLVWMDNKKETDSLNTLKSFVEVMNPGIDRKEIIFPDEINNKINNNKTEKYESISRTYSNNGKEDNELNYYKKSVVDNDTLYMSGSKILKSEIDGIEKKSLKDFIKQTDKYDNKSRNCG